MAALHQHTVDQNKVSVTPGSYIALWADAINPEIPAEERFIIRADGFNPAKQVAPLLLFTPDGTTLQSRATETVFGTLTQHEWRPGEYRWVYTSRHNPQAAAFLSRVWIIDPLPAGEALTLARTTYAHDSAVGRFESYRASTYAQHLFQALADEDEEKGAAVEEAVREIFINAHQRNTYHAEREEAYHAYRQAVVEAQAALDRKVEKELSQASKALANLRAPTRFEIEQTLEREAPMLRQYLRMSQKNVHPALRQAADSVRRGHNTIAIFHFRHNPMFWYA